MRAKGRFASVAVTGPPAFVAPAVLAAREKLRWLLPGGRSQGSTAIAGRSWRRARRLVSTGDRQDPPPSRPSLCPGRALGTRAGRRSRARSRGEAGGGLLEPGWLRRGGGGRRCRRRPRTPTPWDRRAVAARPPTGCSRREEGRPAGIRPRAPCAGGVSRHAPMPRSCHPREPRESPGIVRSRDRFLPVRALGVPIWHTTRLAAARGVPFWHSGPARSSGVCHFGTARRTRRPQPVELELAV